MHRQLVLAVDFADQPQHVTSAPLDLTDSTIDKSDPAIVAATPAFNATKSAIDRANNAKHLPNKPVNDSAPSEHEPKSAEHGANTSQYFATHTEHAADFGHIHTSEDLDLPDRAGSDAAHPADRSHPSNVGTKSAVDDAELAIDDPKSSEHNAGYADHDPRSVDPRTGYKIDCPNHTQYVTERAEHVPEPCHVYSNHTIDDTEPSQHVAELAEHSSEFGKHLKNRPNSNSGSAIDVADSFVFSYHGTLHACRELHRRWRDYLLKCNDGSHISGKLHTGNRDCGQQLRYNDLRQHRHRTNARPDVHSRGSNCCQ